MERDGVVEQRLELGRSLSAACGLEECVALFLQDATNQRALPGRAATYDLFGQDVDLPPSLALQESDGRPEHDRFDAAP